MTLFTHMYNNHTYQKNKPYILLFDVVNVQSSGNCWFISEEEPNSTYVHDLVNLPT